MPNFHALSPAQAQELDALVLDYITTAYQHRGARPEPRINAAEAADYIAQHGRCPEPIRGVGRWVYRATYAALQRLVRAGKLEGSLTLVGGRETRCYNPKA